MKKSYGEGVATHTGPKSCGAAREGSDEALTGECMGRVFSRVRTLLRDADAVRRSGRQHPVHRYREVPQSPARSETPCTYRSATHGNRGYCPKSVLLGGGGLAKAGRQLVMRSSSQNPFAMESF
jgi:hypothetical protein